MRNCPKCESKDIYRKSKHDLVIWCDRCGYHWETSQVKRAIQEFKLYKSKGAMKGTHWVTVWLCPRNKTKFSFSLTYGSGTARFTEPDYPEDPCLKGKFDSPQAAIEAGINEVYNED